MITFLLYQFKVAVIMAVFYIFFRLFLIKDSWHRLNRIVLLSTALLSFLLPVCIITITRTEVQPMPVQQLMQAVSSTPVEPSTPWWHIALIAVYAAGVVFVLARVLASVMRVRSIIRHARKEVLADGTMVYIMPGNAASFSWMGHIVISEADCSNNETAIIRHEKAHVALRHSIDVLITDIIAAAQWFNPAIWMLCIDLRAVHEYEADDTVLRSGTDLRSYQYLLISKAAAMNGYTIANNFNHSILKNRIFMMEKETSTRRSLLRALYLLPLVCICLALNAQTKVNYVYDDFVTEQASQKQDTVNGIPWEVLPGVEFGEDGRMTVNGKTVRKILVNGKEYISDDPDNIYANDIVDEVEGKTPEGYSRSIIIDVDKNTNMISITSEDKENSQWNATAYRLPDAEAVKRLVKLDEETGEMTVNGKKVKRVLVDGKEVPLNEADSLTRALYKQVIGE